MKNHKYKVILSSLIATSGICLPLVSISAISTIDTTSSQTNKEIDPLHTGKEQLKKIINTDSKLSQAQKDAFNTQVTNAKVEEDLNNIKVELEALNKLIEEVSTFSKPSISYAFKLSTKEQQDAFVRSYAELAQSKKDYIKSIEEKTYPATSSQAIKTELKDLFDAYNQLNGIKTYAVIKDALNNEDIIKAYNSTKAKSLAEAFRTLKEVQNAKLTPEQTFDLGKINAAITTIDLQNIIVAVQISGARKQLSDTLDAVTNTTTIPYINILKSFAKSLLVENNKIIATPIKALETVNAELNTLLKAILVITDLSRFTKNTNAQLTALNSFKSSNNKEFAGIAEKVTAIITSYAKAANKAVEDYEKNLQDNLIAFITKTNETVADLSLEKYNAQESKYSQAASAILEELKNTIVSLANTFDPLFIPTVKLATEFDKTCAELKDSPQYSNATQFLKVEVDSLNQEFKKQLAIANDISTSLPDFPALLSEKNANFNHKYIDVLNNLQDIENKLTNTSKAIKQFPNTQLVNGQQAAVIDLKNKLTIFSPDAQKLFIQQYQALPTYEQTIAFVAKVSDLNAIVNKLFVYSTNSLDSSTSSLNVLTNDLGTSKKNAPTANNLHLNTNALISIAQTNPVEEFKPTIELISKTFTNLEDFMFQINKFENSTFATNDEYQINYDAAKKAIDKFSSDLEENAKLSNLFSSVIDLNKFNAANTTRIKDNTLYIKLINAIVSKNVAEFNELAQEQSSDPRINNLIKYIKKTNYLKYTQIPAIKLTTKDRKVMNNVVNDKDFYALSPIAQDAIKFDYLQQSQGFWLGLGILGSLIGIFGFALLFVQKSKKN
ncbi:hypothetical protein [Mycoplasma sp. 4F]|uniref:hypothetical protein n=1 Tax=Mycoplasma sp. 4F TaxID=3401664 RepID=UPI003AAF535B